MALNPEHPDSGFPIYATGTTITQKELAEKIGVSASQLSRIQRRNKNGQQ